MILRQLPNLITLLRILVVPVFVYVTWHGDYQTAFYLFFFAAGSDGLDGILARTFGWTSRLGAMMDPVADKLLMVTSYSLMAWIKAIPTWLFIVVIARDVIIVMGISIVMAIKKNVTIKPFFVSKVNTVLQLLLMTFVLYDLGFTPVDQRIVDWLTVGVVIFSAMSVVMYVVRGTQIILGLRSPQS